MPTALIDGDVLVYACGFAAQESWYECSDGTEWPTLTKAKAHCDKHALLYEDIVERIAAEPKAHCLSTVKKVLLRIMNRTGADDVRVFLTGKENFRFDIGTIRPYKGNRVAKKPFHYQNIRDYLVDVHGAEVIDGQEADDALGINQTEETVICTIDKDLDMIPGWHYNFQTDKLYDIDEWRATYNFYRQLLTGDTVDNIPGVPRIGKKTADKLLGGKVTEEELYWTALEAYSEKYDRPMEALIENARLLWIRRNEGEMWEPPC